MSTIRNVRNRITKRLHQRRNYQLKRFIGHSQDVDHRLRRMAQILNCRIEDVPSRSESLQKKIRSIEEIPELERTDKERKVLRKCTEQREQIVEALQTPFQKDS